MKMMTYMLRHKINREEPVRNAAPKVRLIYKIQFVGYEQNMAPEAKAGCAEEIQKAFDLFSYVNVQSNVYINIADEKRVCASLVTSCKVRQ